LKTTATDTEEIPDEQPERADVDVRQSGGFEVGNTQAAGSQLRMTAAVSVTDSDSEEDERLQEFYDLDSNGTLYGILTSGQNEIAAVTERSNRSSTPTRAQPTGRSRAAGRSATMCCLIYSQIILLCLIIN